MKAATLLSLGCIVLTSCLHAQITFEHEYAVNADSALGPVLIEIAPDEHKYMVQEVGQGSFTLYNLDHTVFMGNVTSPVPLFQAPFYYVPILITRSLFDCESSTLEFAVAATFPDTAGEFNIVRTDGTIIFTEENATVPYCFGCGVGTRLDQGVFNTEDGAKLMMMVWDGIPGQQRYRVYSLCGSLPEGLFEYPGAEQAAIYPNPGSATMTFELPDGSDAGGHLLEVHDMSGQLVLSLNFHGRSAHFDAAAQGLAPGAYTCRVISNGIAFLSRFVFAP